MRRAKNLSRLRPRSKTQRIKKLKLGELRELIQQNLTLLESRKITYAQYESKYGTIYNSSDEEFDNDGIDSSVASFRSSLENKRDKLAQCSGAKQVKQPDKMFGKKRSTISLSRKIEIVEQLVSESLLKLEERRALIEESTGFKAIL
ncbi:hypothetical protein QYM36_014339 [Artemia franciscana]|uniref:Uncharacterized protein n=1 Tax=Artemia franciscana TaxID=6661 RepID=A0AA88HKF8_ARTSF|nr:hypothetical protein QYM36_014339 [Artemia franciscana]